MSDRDLSGLTPGFGVRAAGPNSLLGQDFARLTFYTPDAACALNINEAGDCSRADTKFTYTGDRTAANSPVFGNAQKNDVNYGAPIAAA